MHTELNRDWVSVHLYKRFYNPEMVAMPFKLNNSNDIEKQLLDFTIFVSAHICNEYKYRKIIPGKYICAVALITGRQC